MKSKDKIVLVGLMGVGKTSIGKKLAAKLGYVFVDLDAYIIEQEGCSIKDLFAISEAHFRAIETKALLGLLDSSDKLVLSTGGGAPCFNDNMQVIKKHAVSVHLTVPMVVVADRLVGDDSRPLLAGQSKEEVVETLTSLYENRAVFYESADHTFENFKVNAAKMHALVDQVLADLNN